MSYGAPYRLDRKLSDDETAVITIPLGTTDLSTFPFSEYTLDFACRPVDGCGWRSYPYGQDSTVAVDTDSEIVTVTLATGLRRGQYHYGLRGMQIEGGRQYMLCEGTITVGDGGFGSPSSWCWSDYDFGWGSLV